MSKLTSSKTVGFNLNLNEGSSLIDVPRFNTNYMRNSVAWRGAIVWNTLVPQLNDDIDNVKKYAIMARRSKTLLHLDFDCISPQTLTRREEDFKYN